jgi:hypothetical protein
MGKVLSSRKRCPLTTISPSRTPGHQRIPHRYSAAIPSPAGGQIADTDAV